ncbi:MAG: VOC family protein [Gammaproteobacteria bacterium]
MTIDHLDHLVLTVKNVRTTCEFYTQVLGMQEVTFAGGRKALAFGEQKINLHEQGKELEPRALRPTPGSGDLCFITVEPLQAVMDQLKAHNIEVLEGPVARTGAIGPMMSIYFRDPDNNLIEIANY